MHLMKNFLFVATAAALLLPRPAAADCSVSVENKATNRLMLRGPDEAKDIKYINQKGYFTITIPKGQTRTFQVESYYSNRKSIVCKDSEGHRAIISSTNLITVY